MHGLPQLFVLLWHLEDLLPPPATTMSGFAKIVAHAWSDRTFKQKLLNNPATAMAEHGVKVRRVIENTADTHYLVLPQAPTNTSTKTIGELEKAVRSKYVGHLFEILE